MQERLLFYRQDKDPRLIGGEHGVEPTGRPYDEFIELVIGARHQDLGNLLRADLLRDLDPLTLAISIGVVPIQHCQLVPRLFIEGVIHFNP